MDSILTSIKKLLGIEEDYIHFDGDITMAINSALMVLTQLGIGPQTGFVISDKTATWANFLGDRTDLEAVKSYVHMKAKLMFDPPSNSFLVEAMERHITEFEWRLNVQAELTVTTTVEGGL